MHGFRSIALFALLVTIAATAGSAKELVREFSGNGSMTSAEFEVEAPWILDWRVNSDYPKSMAIEISLVDGPTGYLHGLVVQTKRPGNGVRLFREDGRFRIRVSGTLARWTVKIEQLTRAEAELYTPKERR